MALETELKFRKPDLTRVRENLRRIGARSEGARFERNLVFDDAESSLRRQNMLLRLRQVAGGCVLTFKQPPAGPGGEPGRAKVLDERETAVADFESMLGILAGLGFKPVFAYEKVRETWKLGGAAICLDRLPFGHFVEIEASENEIVRLAAELGLSLEDSTAENYHEINRRHREALDLPPQDSFVFLPEEAERLEFCPEI